MHLMKLTSVNINYYTIIMLHKWQCNCNHTTQRFSVHPRCAFSLAPLGENVTCFAGRWPSL